MQQGALANAETGQVDVISLAQERMTALMSNHKQAEIAFEEVADIVRDQVSTLNRGGLGLDLDIDAGTVDTASPGAATSKGGSFSQEIIVTSQDQKVFSFLLFFDKDRPEESMPAQGKVSDMQREVARRKKLAEGPVLTVAVRDYNEIPPYQIISGQGPVAGMTPSKVVASKEFGTKGSAEGLEEYIATQIADMSAFLTQTVTEQKMGAYSKSEIGFGAEIKTAKKTVERPNKRRIGF